MHSMENSPEPDFLRLLEVIDYIMSTRHSMDICRVVVLFGMSVMPVKGQVYEEM